MFDLGRVGRVGHRSLCDVVFPVACYHVGCTRRCSDVTAAIPHVTVRVIITGGDRLDDARTALTIRAPG